MCIDQTSLQEFSAVVGELYERAAYAGPREFPSEAVQLLRRLITFDGAVLGIGNAGMMLAKSLVIDQACIDGRMDSLQAECADVSLIEPFPRAFFENMDRPIAYDRRDLIAGQAMPQWSDFASRHGVHKFLLYGDALTEGNNARWIMLYRVADRDFQPSDTELLHGLWRHISQAISFNLGRALYRSDPHRVTRAMALVNSRGLIEVADKPMNDLLKLEWPDLNERSLPAAVVSALVQNGIYHGRRIEISGFQNFGYMVCIAKHTPLVRVLAPSEMNVAHRFARGMTHKEIAVHLNVSPHTVRNQLAQVYQKLGVHGKAELARMMSGA